MARVLRLALLLPLLLAPLHGAVLAGDLINVTDYWHGLGDPILNAGNQIAPATFYIFEYYDVTVNDHTIVLTFHNNFIQIDETIFNGPVVTDLSRAPIASVIIDPSSTYPGFDASRLAFDGSHVWINLSGLGPSGTLQLDVFGVPEPATAGLLALALAGLAVASRRRFCR